jgi:hypothetical protein
LENCRKKIDDVGYDNNSHRLSVREAILFFLIAGLGSRNERPVFKAKLAPMRKVGAYTSK